MDSYEAALAGAQAVPEAYFVGGADDHVIDEAERHLGLTFPPSYRRFLAELGAGSIRFREFYGIVPAGLDARGVPNTAWVTATARRDMALPRELIVVSDSGMGEYYVLNADTRFPSGEGPVALYWIGSGAAVSELEIVAPSFRAFFLKSVREASEG